jgi:hypothetical protein
LYALSKYLGEEFVKPTKFAIKEILKNVAPFPIKKILLISAGKLVSVQPSQKNLHRAQMAKVETLPMPFESK